MTDPTEAVPEQLRIGLRRCWDELADVFSGARFRIVDDNPARWRGALTFQPSDDGSPTRTTLIEIVVTPSFPFACPKLIPQTREWAEAITAREFGDDYYEATRGWHLDRDGAMCLYVDADLARLPWIDGADLFEQARAWLANDYAGWPGYEPALDAERYLEPSDEGSLVLYSDFRQPAGALLQLRAERNDVLRVLDRAPVPRRRGGKGSRVAWGSDALFVADAGELTAPIRTWRDLLDAIGTEQAAKLTRSEQAGVQRALVRYSREATQAVLAVEFRAEKGGAPSLRHLHSAPDDQQTRLIRAHPFAAQLKAAQVAIVGVGAIGSVVADLLHRSGIGHLHLVDPDRVAPGNTTRHLLDERSIGLPKAQAVREALINTRPAFGATSFNVDRIGSVDDAVSVLKTYDLVIDATADSTATAMLMMAANAGVGELLSVCVLADGYAIRVDHRPIKTGTEALPGPVLPPATDGVFETGCGSPISTTPPAAVWEAAATATRHAVQLLLDPDQVNAGEERILDATRQLT